MTNEDLVREQAKAHRRLRAAYKEVMLLCEANLERMDRTDSRLDLAQIESIFGHAIDAQAAYRTLRDLSR